MSVRYQTIGEREREKEPPSPFLCHNLYPGHLSMIVYKRESDAEGEGWGESDVDQAPQQQSLLSAGSGL